MSLSLFDDGFHFGTEIPFSLPNLADGLNQLFDGRRLQHITMHAHIEHSTNDRIFIVNGGSNDLQFGIAGNHLLAESDAVTIRQRDVEEQDIRAATG